MAKKLLNTLKIVALALVLSFGISYVYAWTAPTIAAPGANAPAPINTSGTNQTKTGSITAGTISAPTVCVNGDCRSAWPVPSGGGDNLGNHSAGQTLYMNGQSISNAGNVVSSWLYGNVNSSYICLGGNCKSAWPSSSPTLGQNGCYWQAFITDGNASCPIGYYAAGICTSNNRYGCSPTESGTTDSAYASGGIKCCMP